MLGTVISAMGAPLLARILNGALGQINHPAAQAAVKALTDLDNQLPPDYAAQASDAAGAIAEAEMRYNVETLKTINATIQKEILSKDIFVRRMRPAFGYVMAITWGAQMLSIAYIVIFKPEYAGAVMSAAAQLTGIWGIGLSVLGIYVYKRSEDKKIDFTL